MVYGESQNLNLSNDFRDRICIINNNNNTKLYLKKVQWYKKQFIATLILH
jgi:hypothetical protein